MGYCDEVTEEVLEVLIDETEEREEDNNIEEFVPDINFDDVVKSLEWDLLKKEPDRKVHVFTIQNDPATYKGKVLKDLGSDTFIFILEEPEKKMKKIKVKDVETFE